MTRRPLVLVVAVLAAGTAIVVAGQASPPQAPPQQPPAVSLTISGDPGALPRYAVPDFIALSSDAETVEAAKTIGQVLWDDLDFEREFEMIPRDTYATIPAVRAVTDVSLARWRELGADGLVVGTVERQGDSLRVEARLFGVRSRQTVLSKEYTGSVASARLYAHTFADEIYQTQLGLRGVARTRLAFVSDRDGERLIGTVEARGGKEIYVSDYDGANQRRFTVNKSLNINPTWSPDARSLAYTSYVRGIPDIFVSMIYLGTNENPTRGQGQNFLPVWSPDGTRIAFMSTRDGNPEIYVMNRDGSSVRRLTNHPDSDVTPTWSPSGTQIAFVSDRSGSPQIYVVGADGLNLVRKTAEAYCDRPTWSPAPYNEIAYAARTGPAIFDIKVLDLASGERRQLTFGDGSNESPSYAANGRHIAFSSARGGKRQIYTIERTGRNLKQVTAIGNNQTPDWSK